MEASEVRQFSVDELKGRIRQWRDELFRNKFKTQSSEARDTSVIRKLRRDIARGETILRQKTAGEVVETKAPVTKSAKVEDKPVAKKAASKAEAKVEDKVEDKAPTKKAKATKKKGKEE